MNHLRMLAAAAVLGAMVVPAAAVDISGAGATFPYPIYAKWADTYKKETGVGLNYQSIGSGGGIKQIEAKTVTFGASDMPLKGPRKWRRHGLVQFPTVIGGDVPVVNLEGVKSGDLKLDGPTLASNLPRHHQELGRCSDQEAQPESQSADAADCRRPSLGWFRHDVQSGPTIFQRSARSGRARSAPTRRWNGRPASAPRATRALPTTSTQTKGAIGYVEYAYAKQNKLTTVNMMNKEGKRSSRMRPRFRPLPQTPIGLKAEGFCLDPHQPAGRRLVADCGRDVHPRSTSSRKIPRPRPRRSSSSPGLMPRATRWPRNSITCRCPTRSSSAIEKIWASEIKDASGKPLYTAMAQ